MPPTYEEPLRDLLALVNAPNVNRNSKPHAVEFEAFRGTLRLPPERMHLLTWRWGATAVSPQSHGGGRTGGGGGHRRGAQRPATRYCRPRAPRGTGVLSGPDRVGVCGPGSGQHGVAGSVPASLEFGVILAFCRKLFIRQALRAISSRSKRAGQCTRRCRITCSQATCLIVLVPSPRFHSILRCS